LCVLKCSDAVGHDIIGVTGVDYVHTTARRSSETWRKFSTFLFNYTHWWGDSKVILSTTVVAAILEAYSL